MPMPDSKSSWTSLQHNKAHDTHLCWTHTAPVTDQSSSQLPMPDPTGLTTPCSKTRPMIQTYAGDSNRSCVSLQQNKAHHTDPCRCQTQTALVHPCSRSKLMIQTYVVDSTVAVWPCNRSDHMCPTVMWMHTWTAEHAADHDEHPHQASSCFAVPASL